MRNRVYCEVVSLDPELKPNVYTAPRDYMMEGDKPRINRDERPFSMDAKVRDMGLTLRQPL